MNSFLAPHLSRWPGAGCAWGRREREQEKKSKDTSREFERQRQGWVDHQRHDHKGLLEAQEARCINDLKDSRSRLPKGPRAVWAKLTGQYAALWTCRGYAPARKLSYKRQIKGFDTLLSRIMDAANARVFQTYGQKISNLEKAKALAAEQLAKQTEPKSS